jgi:hypothetical protein
MTQFFHMTAPFKNNPMVHWLALAFASPDFHPKKSEKMEKRS